jgi:hypothetical protein
MANETKTTAKPGSALKPGARAAQTSQATAGPVKKKLPPRAGEDCCAPGEN